MPHTRSRHIASFLMQQSRFWPVVGLLGPRQCGKTTLIRDQLALGKFVTLDDPDTLDDARSSPVGFLNKQARPLIVDEIQKAPALFDSIKLLVDRNKRPGSFFITGSSQFSSKQGIRESLTGRMGLHYLYPLTLAEAHQKAFEIKRANPLHKLKSRFELLHAQEQFLSGGLPVPLFCRDEEQIRNYFQSWMDTTLIRDTARAYGPNYDPDRCLSIINQMVRYLQEGELPTLKHFKQNSRLLRRYLIALEDVFLIRKIPCHDKGVGSDAWTFSDTGFFAFWNKGVIGKEATLSFARVFVLKEILALCEYAGARLRPVYYKTARSHAIDLVWDNVPIKISQAKKSQLEYDLRPLRAAMKVLGSKNGVLLVPYDLHEQMDGVLVRPWTHFS